MDVADAGSDDMEWGLYAAVDLRNSLPYERVERRELVKLNLRVAKVAKSRGSQKKENELLQKSLTCLETAGQRPGSRRGSVIRWKDYSLTLEIYNAWVISEQ